LAGLFEFVRNTDRVAIDGKWLIEGACLCLGFFRFVNIWRVLSFLFDFLKFLLEVIDLAWLGNEARVHVEWILILEMSNQIRRLVDGWLLWLWLREATNCSTEEAASRWQ